MTDAELDAIMSATREIPPARRVDYLQAVAYRLQHSGEVGDGIVARAIMSTRRDLLGPQGRTMTFILR